VPSRRPSPIAQSPGRRPAAPIIALLGLFTAAVVALAGGGQVVWLSVPAALLAASRARTQVGSALAVAAVTGLSVAASVLVVKGHAGTPVALVLVVAAASAAVLVSVRERLEHDRDVLRDFALSDPVTGAANRRSLLMRADYEIQRHRRADRSFALLMLDLDGFKLLNDRFGHAAGDDLLKDVAAALRHAMRGQDTVARFGGDEFCVLAPETDEQGIGRLAARVTSAVRGVSAGLEAVAGSVGIAVFPDDGRTVSELMQVADERLLEAKRRLPAGRSQRRVA
jgi:diguanylate cyclase (GGDEF)-like protein